MNTCLTYVSCVTLAIATLALGGCGAAEPDYGSLDLCTAGGRVTLDGTPLEKALVLFEAEDTTFSFGLTDADGQYRLMFNSRQPGVRKGTKTVRIWSSRGIPGAAEAGAGGAAEEGDDPDGVGDDGRIAPAAAERVPPKYNVDSELTAVVESDGQTFDFELRSPTAGG
jgi:hypothetical protein